MEVPTEETQVFITIKPSEDGKVEVLDIDGFPIVDEEAEEVEVAETDEDAEPAPAADVAAFMSEYEGM